MLISRVPPATLFSTATRSQGVRRLGFSLYSRKTPAPGTSSSAQRPVFLTWARTGVPSGSETSARKRLGLAWKTAL